MVESKTSAERQDNSDGDVSSSCPVLDSRCSATCCFFGEKKRPKVCIIGAGNASHILAAWLPARGFETFWFAPFADEAKRLQEALKGEEDCLQACFHSGDDGTDVGKKQNEECSGKAAGAPVPLIVQGKPTKISAEAAEVIPQCDVLLAPLPSFAYRSVFEKLNPCLRPGQFIGVSPGQGGLDWTAAEVLGKPLFRQINLFAILPMPFNCRLTEFGRSADVTVLKRNFKVAASLARPRGGAEKKKGEENGEEEEEEAVSTVEERAASPADVCGLVRLLFNAKEVDFIGTLLTATLYPINAVIHPGRNFCIVGEKYQTGDRLSRNPLFYEEMDAASASVIEALSLELVTVAETLCRKACSGGKVNPLLPLAESSSKEATACGSCADTTGSVSSISGSRVETCVPTVLQFLQFVYGAEFENLQQMFRNNDAYKGFRSPFKRVDRSGKRPPGWEPDFASRYYTEDIPLGLCVVQDLASMVGCPNPMTKRILRWAQCQMGKEYFKEPWMITPGRDFNETAAPTRFGLSTLEKLVDFYSR